MSAIDQIEELATRFRTLGHVAITPDRDERDDSWTSLTLTEQVEAKREFIDAYLEQVRSADAIVIANFARDGISGYVGPNTLIEAAFAKALGRPVYLYNEPGPQPAQVELLAVQMACLYGDPRNLPTTSNS
ncbi:MAG: hypothetical protein ACR2PK_18935 [Acidimicrobiales bacterium]